MCELYYGREEAEHWLMVPTQTQVFQARCSNSIAPHVVIVTMQFITEQRGHIRLPQRCCKADVTPLQWTPLSAALLRPAPTPCFIYCYCPTFSLLTACPCICLCGVHCIICSFSSPPPFPVAAAFALYSRFGWETGFLRFLCLCCFIDKTSKHILLREKTDFRDIYLLSFALFLKSHLCFFIYPKPAFP